MNTADEVAAAKAAPAVRFARIDVLRGLAMVWMAGFHLCFDLNHFGLLEPRQNFYRDPFWLNQRTVIVTLFLLCVGLGQAVALRAEATGGLASRFSPRFWRRWLQVAACALAVTLGSALMFPKSWIGFGVLHGIAVMLILARLAAPLGTGLWPLAVGALLLPQLWRHPFFDEPYAHWVGLVTRKPITEDWVPVLPWVGVVLIGLALGRWLLGRRRSWLAGAVPRVTAPLALLGRWPLSFYMLHQPVFIGIILGGRALGAW